METAQFASARLQIPWSADYISVSLDGENTVERVLYLSLQIENQVGLNYLSILKDPITVPVGKSLRIVLPQAVKKTGEDFLRYIISASTSNNPQTFVQLCAINLYELNAGVLTTNPFPLIVTLSKDEHFKLQSYVQTASDLPSDDNLIEGMVRGVVDDAKFYEYIENPLWTQSLVTSLDADPSGKWVQTNGFGTYIIDSTAGGGCNQSLRSINPAIVKASRWFGGESLPQKFWLVNRSQDVIPQGTRIGFAFSADGDSITDLISGIGAAKVTFNGIVNTTGELETSNFQGVGIPRVFKNRKTNLIVPRNVQPGESLSFSIALSTTVAALQSQIGGGQRIKSYPFVYQQAGSYEVFGLISGDLIIRTESPIDEFGLVLPNVGLSVLVGNRTGIVDAFAFIDIPRTTVYNLPSNSLNIKLGINGNGDVYQIFGSVQGFEALLAVVGTLDGVGKISNYTGNFTVAANTSIKLTVTHPVLGGYGVIRADYPELTVRGKQCFFNPSQVTIFVQRISDSQIRRFDNFYVTTSAAQEIIISDWSGGFIVSSLPTPYSSDFGFFQTNNPTAINSTDNAGNFPADTYRVCFGYKYENTVSIISRSPEYGCIGEAYTSIQNLFTLYRSWGDSVLSSLISSISISKIFNGQTRRIIDTGQLIYFDGGSTAAHNGTSVWKPNEIDASSPGRWIVDPGYTMSDQQILDAVKRLDGSGSGLDADLLDGLDSTAFSLANHLHDATYLNQSDNLNDLPNKGTARTNIGAGDAYWNANKIQGKDVNTTSPTDGQTFRYRTATQKWEIESAGISDSEILDAIKRVDSDNAGINATTLQGLPPNAFVLEGDTRLTNSRAPTGNADGTDIQGTFPSNLELKTINGLLASQTGTKVTVNSKGRVTAVSSFTDADLPNTIAYVNKSNSYSKIQIVPPISIASDPDITIVLNPSDANHADSNKYKLYLQHNTRITINGGIEGASFTLFVKNQGGRTIEITNGLFAGGEPDWSNAPTDSLYELSFDYCFGVWFVNHAGVNYS